MERSSISLSLRIGSPALGIWGSHGDERCSSYTVVLGQTLSLSESLSSLSIWSKEKSLINLLLSTVTVGTGFLN